MKTSDAESGQNELSEWVPYKIVSTDGQLLCQWLYLDGVPLADPFYFESTQKALKSPFNSSPYRIYSSLDFLLELAAQTKDWIAPDIFIFHVSRCGSTLLTQMLCEDERNIVLSEANILDEILSMPFNKPELCPADTDPFFKAALCLMGRKRTGIEQHLFIKTDSWHVFFYENIRRLYPDTPILLLYRAPDEVLRSHRKFAGLQAIPHVINPAILGFTAAEMEDIMIEPYTAAVLARFLKQFCRIYQEDGSVSKLNYNSGAMGLLQALQLSCGFEFNAEIIRKMTERSQYHAKKPEEVFAETQVDSGEAQLLQEAFYWYCQLDQLP